MKKLMIIISALVFVVVMNGCAAIWSKSEYDVSVRTNSSQKHNIKFIDTIRKTEHHTDSAGTAHDLKSYGERVALGHKANIFQIIVDGKDEYPSVISYVKATESSTALLGVLLGPGFILTASIDSLSGCLYNLPDDIFIDMELMKEAKAIGVAEWMASEKQDSGIIVNSGHHSSFVVPRESDKVIEIKKGHPVNCPYIWRIESKGIKVPFNIYNSKQELVYSGTTPAKISEIEITDKFFVVFHYKGDGFYIYAIPANPHRINSLFFEIAENPDKTREFLKKYKKYPERFYALKPLVK
jgi:hypothetical protein